MSEFEERPTSRPTCEQADLRPAGGDLVPDRFGLGSQSMACLPPEVGEFFRQTEEADSPCDKAYQDVERMTGLKDKLGISACDVGRRSAEALGAYGGWRAGLRVVGGVGRNGVPKVAAATQKPNLVLHQGGKGRGQGKSPVADEHAVMEILTLAASGRCPTLAGALGAAQTTARGEVIPRFMRHAGTEYIVLETRGEVVRVVVFSRNGELLMGHESLPAGAGPEAVMQALRTVVARFLSRSPGGAG